MTDYERDKQWERSEDARVAIVDGCGPPFIAFLILVVPFLIMIFNGFDPAGPR